MENEGKVCGRFGASQLRTRAFFGSGACMQLGCIDRVRWISCWNLGLHCCVARYLSLLTPVSHIFGFYFALLLHCMSTGYDTKLYFITCGKGEINFMKFSGFYK